MLRFRSYHHVGPHGGLYSRLIAVLADEDVGGAVDVEVGGHDRRTISTAAAVGAPEAVTWVSPILKTR